MLGIALVAVLYLMDVTMDKEEETTVSVGNPVKE